MSNALQEGYLRRMSVGHLQFLARFYQGKKEHEKKYDLIVNILADKECPTSQKKEL